MTGHVRGDVRKAAQERAAEVTQAETNAPRLWARVANVRRYAELMTDSISVDRAEMARDILDILDGRLGDA